jgi:hypothetical protein
MTTPRTNAIGETLSKHDEHEDCPPVGSRKERPILFSAPMVRALLDGTKTQTRRVVKPPRGYRWLDLAAGTMVNTGGHKMHRSGLTAPYGQPGDRLWVRETHAPQPDCSLSWDRWLRGCGDEKPIIHYAADASRTAWVDKWRPSIHMPAGPAASTSK